jgi:hypothetical protein
MGMNRRIRVLVAVLPIVISCCGPVAARAQGPGVTFDTDSPAGKEYVIPLDEARQIGGGVPTTPSDGRRSVSASAAMRDALFGAGVQRSRSTAASGNKGIRSKSSSERPDTESASSPGSAATGSGASQVGSGASQVERALGASGGRQRSAGLLIGAAALLLVALGTLVLRRRGRRNA